MIWGGQYYFVQKCYYSPEKSHNQKIPNYQSIFSTPNCYSHSNVEDNTENSNKTVTEMALQNDDSLLKHLRLYNNQLWITTNNSVKQLKTFKLRA